MKAMRPKGRKRKGGNWFKYEFAFMRKVVQEYLEVHESLKELSNTFFFNNTYCHGLSKMPSILLMGEPAKDTNVLDSVWEYNCTAEEYKRGFYSGGIATELTDGSFFICMGSDFPKLQIVNRDKKTLWCALPEMRSKDGKEWVPFEKIYRGNLITRKELELLIWAAEKNR